jgi:hypothetical protein
VRRTAKICTGAILFFASASMVLADGGVVLKDMTSSLGIQYARKSSPDREAERAAELAMAPFPISQRAMYVINSPQKWHGAPGVALLDYDNDGDLDIYVTNGPGRANSLFKNLLKETGQLQFVDVATEAGVDLTAEDSSGVCFGDIDNDGWEDLYVVSTGGQNHLFHNNGNGTFTEITQSAGVGGDYRYASACSMGDVNNDGLLDIAVSNTYHPWNNRKSVFTATWDPNDEQDYLFLNTGGNVFQDVSAKAGFESLLNVPDFGSPPGNPTFTWALALVDINQDGNIDYFGAEDSGARPQQQRGVVRYLKNDGTGNFSDQSVPAHTNETGGLMGFAFSDFNCDGNMDFFVTDLGTYLAPGPPAQNSRWFLGQSDGTFKNPGVGQLGGTPFGWGASAFDYDNDGDDDIIYYGDVDLLANLAHDNPGTLLQNTGNCTANFAWDINAIERDHRDRIPEGLATGDLNNDGFDDVVSVSEMDVPDSTPLFAWVGSISGPHGSVFDPYAGFNSVLTPTSAGVVVYHDPHVTDGSLVVEINSANNGNKSVSFKLLGAVGLIGPAPGSADKHHPSGKVNRDGIGAIVHWTPNGLKTVSRPVLGGSSYASESSLTQTFGIGKKISGTVEVMWPGGAHNRLYDVKPDERLTLPEIPCDFKNFNDGLGPRATRRARRAIYQQCVDDALQDLSGQGRITRKYQARLEASALRAYDDATRH